MNKLEIKNIFKEYKKLDILSSFLTALIFFVLYGSVFLLPTILIIYLYVPFVEYFLIGIYIYMSLMSVYFNKIFTDTLKTYHESTIINYEKFRIRSSTVMTFIVFVVVFIIYIFVH